MRQRLGSISRFVQELKQTFSVWYNKRHNRKGYIKVRSPGRSRKLLGVIFESNEEQLSESVSHLSSKSKNLDSLSWYHAFVPCLWRLSPFFSLKELDRQV